jgi:hypothetical protein
MVTIHSIINMVSNYTDCPRMSAHILNRLCGLVVRVSGYRSRGPEFDSRRFQIFWEAAGLERGPLSLVRPTEELLEEKVAAPV